MKKVCERLIKRPPDSLNTSEEKTRLPLHNLDNYSVYASKYRKYDFEGYHDRLSAQDFAFRSLQPHLFLKIHATMGRSLMSPCRLPLTPPSMYDVFTPLEDMLAGWKSVEEEKVCCQCSLGT